MNNAKVTQADIQARNGVIHAIDNVILPQETVSQLETTPRPVSQN
ncbi:fasciclin domain-containing protein [Allocoleopsis franciscana]|nr:fasciclin domain-containing protein [Allocoleopsis franciscana]